VTISPDGLVVVIVGSAAVVNQLQKVLEAVDPRLTLSSGVGSMSPDGELFSISWNYGDLLARRVADLPKRARGRPKLSSV